MKTKKMSREGVLLKNTLIITVGKVSTQMISFFLLPLYTTILSTEEFGIVDLLNTLVALMLPIVTFQIEQAVFRYLIDIRGDDKRTKVIITTTLFTILMQCIIYLIIFTAISGWINNQYKFFLASNVIACIFSSIMLQIARGLGDNKTYAVGSFITAITTIIFNIIFLVIFKYGAYGMLIASLLGNIICALYVFIKDKINRYISLKKFDKNLLKKLWKYSIPLIPNALSWWIFNASDRVIVSGILGLSVNGILAAAHKFPGVYITIYNIFNMSWTETASIHINDEDKDIFFNNIINTILKLFTTISFCIIAVMPFIFNIIINDKFIDAYNQIPILMIASIFNVLIGLFSVIYIAKKDTKAIAKTTVIAAIINIIVNLGLIKFIGLYAASISTLVAYLAISIHRYIDINRNYINLKFDKKFIILSMVICTFTCLTYYLKNSILNIVSVIVVIIYALVINYKSINFIKDIILKKIRGIK